MNHWIDGFGFQFIEEEYNVPPDNGIVINTTISLDPLWRSEMPRFAIYYVPGAEEDFYKLGTSIIGYDQRARKYVQMSEEMRQLVGEIKPEWVSVAQLYGFHATIGCPLDFNWGDILNIEREIRDLLDCFDPTHRFTLRQRRDFVWIGGAAGLAYDSNEYLKMFHTLVLGRMPFYSTGSFYIERYHRNPKGVSEKPHLAKRILKFYNYPMVLDDWGPHFTLLNPYNGGDSERLRQVFTKMFSRFKEIAVDSICLLVQMKDGDNWEIYKEFELE